jgi:hypothetical protein
VSQQILPTSKLRKGFLAIGIVLLVLGFFFFYVASRTDYQYSSEKDYKVNITQPSNENDYSFGNVWAYDVTSVKMQQNDVITVEESGGGDIFGNAIFNNEGVVAYSNGYVSFTTNEEQWVSVIMTLPSNANLSAYSPSIETVIVTLYHYETPQWAYFGIGIVLCSLAMIPIFKSKK